MPHENEQPGIPEFGSDLISPVFIAQLASRLFNELPEAGSVPKYETDVAGAPSSLAATVNDKKALGEEAGRFDTASHLPTQELPLHPELPYFSDDVPAHPEHDFYFLSGAPEKKQEPLGHHANKLTEQQNYSDNKNGSYGLDQFIQRSLPAKPDDAENIAPFFTTLNGGLPAEDDFSFKVLLAAAQDPV